MTDVVDELTAFLRQGLHQPEGRAVVMTVMRSPEGGTRVVTAATNELDEIADGVLCAHTLPKAAAKTILESSHPNCPGCQDRLARIQGALDALGIDQAMRRLLS